MNRYLKSVKKGGGGLYSLFLLFLLFLSLPQQGFTSDKILFQTGNYKLTQKNANDLLELAEYIGGSRFSKKDRKALQLWSVSVFSYDLKINTDFYKTLAKITLPKIRKSKSNNTYRAELYLLFYEGFKKHPKYKQLPDNFLSIVDRYKPPTKEILLIHQIRFNRVMQQMQSNQRMFNRSMQQMQRSSDNINKSIKDQATRSAITIPGGQILRETDSKVFAEDYRGQKYEVTK